MRNRTFTFVGCLVMSTACGGSSSDDVADTTAGDGASMDGSAGDGGDGADGGGDGTDATAGSGGTDDGADSGSDDGSDGPTGGDPPGVCGQVATFEDGAAPTSEIHVATDGNDAGGCGAAEAPCASLSGAATQAGPGSAIVVHAGTYAGGAWLEGLAGTQDAPIWIGGAEGEPSPRFEGDLVAFTLRRPAYVIVHDLEIANTTANGINVDDGSDYDNESAAHHVVFRNLTIHDIGEGGNNDCLKLSGLNDFFVLHNDMSGCGGGLAGSGIDHVGCHRGVVAYNWFHDMAESGNAVQTKGGSEDIEIRANRFDNAGSRALNLGGSTDFEYFRPPLGAGDNAEARNIRAIANVIVGSDAAVAFVGCVDCLAANNTIVDPVRWTIRILQETQSGGGFTFLPARDGTFVNNVVYFQRAGFSTNLNVGEATAPETFSFATNLWFAHDDPGQSDPSGELSSPESGGIYGQDPGFVDDEFRIDGSSPAAGAGTALAEVGGDMGGDCYGQPPAIGAWSPE